MLRKLVSALTFFALLALPLVGFSAANAVDSSPYSAANPASVGNSDLILINLNDTATLAVWSESADSVVSVKSGVMGMDGVIANIQTLTSDSSTSYRIQTKDAWTKLPDGTVALSWVKTVYGSNYSTITKSVEVTYTSDGIDWTQPVSPFEAITFNAVDCDYGSCGFSSARLTSDGIGNMAIAVEYLSPGPTSSASALVKTSSNGTTWSSPSTFTKQVNYLSIQSIKGLPAGGFLLTWVDGSGSTSRIFAVRTIGATISSWTRPSQIEMVDGYGYGGLLVQTSSETMGLFFAREINNDYTTLYRKDFNFVTKSWGPLVELTVATRSFLNYGGLIGNYSHGVATILSSFGVYGESTTLLRGFVIVNGITQPTIERTEAGGQDTVPLVASARADGSVYFGWTGQFAHPYLAVYKAGSQIGGEEIPLGLSRAFGSAAVSPNGNIYFYFYHFAPADVRLSMTFRGAIAPTPTGTLLLKGSAKVGSKLSAILPVFTSPSGVGTTKMQWYSCNAPITVIQTSIPAGCLPITKANTVTFKLTTKQKKKYLGLAVTNTNPVGAVTIFGKTTARIK